MKKLDRILDRHQVPEKDRPALRALIELGVRPDAKVATQCRRGKYRGVVDDALTALSAGLPYRFPS